MLCFSCAVMTQRYWRHACQISKRTVVCHSDSQTLQIVVTRNFLCSEWLGGDSHHLNVEQQKPMLPQMLDQMIKRHFGCVVGAMEHGFTREQTAKGQAIDAAHQFSVLPAFNAVSMTLLVQKGVCLDEFFGDPGTSPFGAGRGTCLHHGLKSLVNCDFKDRK